MKKISKELKILYPNAITTEDLVGLLFADLSLKNSIIEDQNEEIETLKTGNIVKDEEIETLKTDNIVKDEEIETLKTDNIVKDEEIETLKANNLVKDQHVEALQADITDKDSKILALKYQVANLAKYRFSRRSEKLDKNQLWLFPEILENDPKSNSDKPETKKVKCYTRKVSCNQSLTLPANTPVVEVEHKEELQECETCHSKMAYGEKLIQYRIAHVPASTIIIKDIRWQQKCITCCPAEGESPRFTAPIRGDVLYDTICTPTFLASVLVDRIQYNLPLFRIEHRFNLPKKQIISRQVLSSWLIKAYTRLLGLQRALERKILTYPMLSADETNYPCLKSDNKNKLIKERADKLKILKTFDKTDPFYDDKEKDLRIPPPSKIKNAMKCFIMVRATTCADGSRGPVMYNYFETRDNSTIRGFVGDYKGFLLTDGLKSYRSIANEAKSEFVHGTCLVHSSRKIKAILDASPKNEIAIKILERYTIIFHSNNQLIERRKKMEFINDEKFMKERKKILLPLFENLKEILETYNTNHFVSVPLKRAINYPLNKWEGLLTFMDFPYGEITNNYSEQRIKAIILGRKASLFSNTPQGARATAFYYSLVESCKAIGVDTHTYLTYVLSNSRGIVSEDEWDAMLPGSVDLTETEVYLEELVKKATPDKNRIKEYIIRGKRERLPKKKTK
jgi:transposase